MVVARAAMLLAVLARACACATASAAASNAAATTSPLLLCAHQVVVALPSSSPPLAPPPPPPLARRDKAQPFFAFDPPSSSSSPSEAAVTSLINSMAAAFEAATGRRLFPLRAVLATPSDIARACGGGGGGKGKTAPSRPLVSWDPSTNMMVARRASGGEFYMESAAVLFPLALDVARRVAGGAAGAEIGAAAATVHAARAAVAAALVLVPLWQCIACVAVLGLLFPLAINAALGVAVDAACAAMALDPTSCFDLALGALLAGVVLAALSSVAIFRMCRLAQCRRTTAAAALLPPPA